MSPTSRTLSSVWIACCLAACGGGQPEAKEPAPEPSESAAAPEKPAEADAGPKSEPKEEEPKATKSPKDTLTAEGVMFSFSFNESEAYQKADDACSKKAGDDPKKKADCMGKARDKIDGDNIVLKQEPDETWWWIVIRRNGTKVSVLHKFQIEFGEETEKTITLKTKGPDKGSKAGGVPSKIVVEVTDNGIVLSDPKNGKMVYGAKMGALGASER